MTIPFGQTIRELPGIRDCNNRVNSTVTIIQCSLPDNNTLYVCRFIIVTFLYFVRDFNDINANILRNLQARKAAHMYMYMLKARETKRIRILSDGDVE